MSALQATQEFFDQHAAVADDILPPVDILTADLIRQDFSVLKSIEEKDLSNCGSEIILEVEFFY